MEKFEISQEQEDFVNTNALRLLNEIADKGWPPVHLLGLCGSLVANIIHDSDGEVELDTCLEFIKMGVVATQDEFDESDIKRYEGQATE